MLAMGTYRPQPYRSGSVFIFILAVIGVLFAIAFGMLSSSRMASTSGFETDPEILSDQVANEGLAHAIGTINKSFLVPGIPTNFGEAWRRDFWAIDTHRRGEDQDDWDSDYQRGVEDDEYDHFENDLHLESLLTDFYNYPTKSGMYLGREDNYADGWLGHPGTGRWYEPSRLAVDPSPAEMSKGKLEKPLSWHLLDHPVAKNPGSMDPAERRGEPDQADWPEFNGGFLTPIRYDAQWRATDDPSKVRFRLRYAVAIEALDGHLLASLPALYADTIVSAANGGIPDDDVFAVAMEFDRDRADRWAPSLYEFGRRMTNDTPGLELMFRGQGNDHEGNDYLWRPVLAGISGTGPQFDLQVWQKDADGRPALKGLPIKDRNVHHEGLGVIPSFEELIRKNSGGYSPDQQNRSMLFSPFGRAPTAVANPSQWYEAYVDTPWAINVPTATPKTIMAMLYAYLPQEFKTGEYNMRSKEDWKEEKLDEDVWWNKRTEILTGNDRIGRLGLVNLFAVHDSPSGPYFAATGGLDLDGDGMTGADPYPGTDPQAGSADRTLAWHHELGYGCAVNEGFPRRQADGTIDLNAYPGGEGFRNPVLSILGSVREGYTMSLFENITEKYDDFLGGEKWVKYDSGSGTDLNAQGGFYYDQSYYMDLAMAYLHTMAACQYVWADHVDGLYAGDPLRGVPAWIHRDDPDTPPQDGEPIPPDYFDDIGGSLEFAPNTVCRDRDVDGDGRKDVPSTFDSVIEVDAQFLRNLGEWPGQHATGSRPLGAHVGLEMGMTMKNKWSSSHEFIPMLRYRPLHRPAGDAAGEGVNVHYNIAQRRQLYLADPNDPYAITDDQANALELVLNDFRMSFFGASPQYPDFRPIDFSDDGIVCSSAYAGGRASAEFATGYGPEPKVRWSLTGYFTFAKTRFYRIFYRGEAFDVLSNVVVGQTNGEAVYCVDPDGDMLNVRLEKGLGTKTGMADSHLLFKRYHLNRYRGSLSNVSR